MYHTKIIFTAAFLTLSSIILADGFYHHKSGNGEKITLSHTIHTEEVKDGFSRLTRHGEGYTTELGMPELPLFTTLFQLNPEKEYDFQLEVVSSEIIENISVLPHQGMEKWEIENISAINTEFYSSYNSFPETNLTVSDRIQGRGIEFVNLQVIPYKYFPKYNRLEVFTDISIHVIEIGENPNPQLQQPKRSRVFDAFYKDIMVNFTESENREDYQHPAILYICGGNTLNNSYVQQLVDWRHKQGYIVYAVSESEVGGSSASTSEIKTYIQNAYFGWENPPEMIGLIGDTGGSNSLPSYSHSWYGYSGATDFDYTQLDGNDLYPEVFIGRISGSTSDIENIINKTIYYEKATQVEDDWFTKAGLIGDPDESGNSTIYTNQYIENMMNNYGMNRVNTDYDGSGTETFMEQQFNSGILYYNYRGYYYGSGSYPTNSINNGWETPFVTTITCGTGDFDGTSSSESFVWLGSVNNPRGAVGAVGMGTIGTHTLYNNIVDMGIYDGIFPKALWYAGAAVANGDLAIVATYPNPASASSAAEAFSKWSNLIGDPALHLWSGVPDNFSVQLPETIAMGTTTLELMVNDESGNPVKDAVVTLLMGDDIIFTSQRTDENGNVVLEWEATEAGEVAVTIIKRDFRPFEGSIQISAAAGAAISLISTHIEVESGSYADLNITLQNFGRSHADNVWAELKTNSDQITIENPYIAFGDIYSEQKLQKQAHVYIHGTAYENEDLGLSLYIQDDDGNQWINHIPVTVRGAKISVTGYHGDAIPGINSDLYLTLENQGSRSGSGMSARLLSYENLVTVHTGTEIFESFPAGNNYLIQPLNVDFSDQIINGSVIPVEIVLTASDGFKRSQFVSLTVGETRETDPVGPDAHGYYIYDSGDTEYDLAPQYEWIEIADGTGTQLSISDSGHGNCSGSAYTCSSTTVELPFEVTFYGEDYDHIVVNTNGWISFGTFKMYSFRNYPLPGAGGPSPMIAAFWDDLKTGSGGYVHYHATNDRVVIQWDNMRTYDNNGSSRETFQIILYNKDNMAPTPTGDSEIKIQYQDFNNSSDGNYGGYPPIHGCYSTVGIENRMSTIGLQYTFNNSYAEAAMPLSDGDALFITTRTPQSYELGDFNEDGMIDVLDVVGLVNTVLNGGYAAPADMNQDGISDILDIVSLVNLILG
ncbi:MAG: C25 family peptidase propeptide domain-containing protein [Candidatus Marinimicrobia bacterium]|nr:C25 family peptidase propeptide domain-containing protein [Candidatus Neomarinimicrobiota bacterium]